MITGNTFTIILGIALLFSREVKTDDEGDSSEGNNIECARTCDRQCPCVMQIESCNNDDLIALIQHMYSDNRDIHSLKVTVENLVTLVQQLSTNAVNIGLKDCKDLYDKGYHNSGVYTLNLGTPVSVYCDQVYNGGGWTVIQNRFDGTVDFYKTWNEYKFGFGNPSGEYWLGNEYVHLITHKRPQRIRFEFEDFDGNTAWAEYENFVISNESDGFRMNIDVKSYTGTAGDSFIIHTNMKFSTKDRDNDMHATTSCAVTYNGAWWFKACFDSHLNGVYQVAPSRLYAEGLMWRNWKGIYYSLKRTTMKIQPM